MGRFVLAACVGAFVSLSGSARAQEVVGSYAAYIGEDDLYNSQGERLTEPWQVLRQDRANYHKFKIRQRGDEGDPFFSNVNNRAAMEQMVMNGSIEAAAARDILHGGATVYVTIYGHGGRGDYVDVTVVR